MSINKDTTLAPLGLSCRAGGCRGPEQLAALGDAIFAHISDDDAANAAWALCQKLARLEGVEL